ncbi:DMT family transporter [Corallococcus praedator]|uniref:DMT family transporter n=1 Tax=Corallococcus praedator TaxID=2316724 RepID=A0ABX9QMI7_9BACT|nr:MULTISPECIES: DMT family transporter [Corallococcus]RKH32878.1 DMT family transporter [Corallococcus sp. CA031C]RKI13672.1 DMT family transporter [Corallococcus praedator]
MGASPTGVVTPGAVAAPLGRVYAALGLQVLISAGTYLAAKRAMTELSPFTVVLWRFLVCGVAFTLLLALTPGPKLPPRSAWKRVALLGLMGGPVNQTLFFSGLSRSTSAHAALLYALTPLGVYVASLVLGRERASRRATLGILTALVGVVVLLLGRGLASAQGSLQGDLLILMAVVAWVIYTTEGRPLASEYGALRATAWTMTVATALQLPLIPFVLEPAQVWAASFAAKAAIVYLGLMTSVVAYLLWYYALSKVPASKVAIFSNLQPAATALAAWAFLDEALHWELALGGALVLLGVRLTQAAPVKPAPVVVRAG